MAFETVGRYQLHLSAIELPVAGQWDAFVTILKFDEQSQSLKCVVEQYPVAGNPYPSYESAIEAARAEGNALIKSGKL